MKNNSLVLASVLAFSFCISTLADYKNNQFSQQEKIDEKSAYRHAKTHDEEKQEIITQILKALAVGTVGLYFSQRDCIKDTGADVGLAVSSILMSLSCFMDKDKARALRSMAYAATPLSMMAVGLSSDVVSGKDGLLANYGYFGVDKLFKNTTGRSKYGLLGLLTIAGYVGSKPLIAEGSSIVEDLCSSNFNKAKHWYHSHRN